MSRSAIVLAAAAVLGAASGCMDHSAREDLDEDLACGHVVIQIGHGPSPEKEQVVLEDGARERVWLRTAGESAARAVLLLVKHAEEADVEAGDFREVSRTPARPGFGERVVLERDRSLDPYRRSFKVMLRETGGYWIPQAIVVCQEDLPGEEF